MVIDLFDESDIEESNSYCNIEENNTLEKELKEKISNVLTNDLIIFNNVYVRNQKEYNTFYREKFNISDFSELNKSLFLCKEKNNEIYNNCIISKINYFLIKRKNEIIKIDKSDIIRVTAFQERIIFLLKNNEIIIDLNRLIYDYKINDKYVKIPILYNYQKIIDFFYEEIDEFIDKQKFINSL